MRCLFRDLKIPQSQSSRRWEAWGDRAFSKLILVHAGVNQNKPRVLARDRGKGPPSTRIAIGPRKGGIRTGIARFIHGGGRLPPLHRHGPIEDSLRALAIVGVEREAWSVISLRSAKTRMGRQIVGWWRGPQAQKGHSSPTLPSPRGLIPNL